MNWVLPNSVRSPTIWHYPLQVNMYFCLTCRGPPTIANASISHKILLLASQINMQKLQREGMSPDRSPSSRNMSYGQLHLFSFTSLRRQGHACPLTETWPFSFDCEIRRNKSAPAYRRASIGGRQQGIGSTGWLLNAYCCTSTKKG